MARTLATAAQRTLPMASISDTLAVINEVVLPTIAKGVIIRRPKVVATAQQLDLDRRAVQRVQQLREKYGSGPLLLRIPVRSQAILLAPEHVQRVLENSPEPFATASSEKRAALGHFQPEGVLVSHGPARAERRRFNEQVLETNRPVHHLAGRFLEVVDEEAAILLAAAEREGELNWPLFASAWFRVVRRIVLGDAARDDEELTDMLAALRADANWAFFKPKRSGLRRRFYQRLRQHLARAEEGSLASLVATTPSTALTAPEQQVPQWLFAFDPAGMTTFRTLALLASHPKHAERVREEIKAHKGSARQHMPFLRACVHESLRLWPTTPMILRQTTEETEWESGTMPAKTGIMIYAPFFHRDDKRLPFANRMAPELWLKERSTKDWPLVPFSAGPAVCAARHLVPLVTSAMLAALLDGHHIRLKPPLLLDAKRPLPGTLNNYGLRFGVSS
ncbi:MAG: cytochrome P450 [Chloroflexaceae bacterium]|nr:cytochrome P450 [Chloroflexaceae bacterium]